MKVQSKFLQVFESDPIFCDHIDKELIVLKWMMGVMLTGVITLVLKAFFI